MLSVYLLMSPTLGNPYVRGRLSKVDLLALTSLDQLLLKIQTFTFLLKQATLLRRSTVLIYPLQLAFPAYDLV
jgi:hypothetical protein